MNRRGFTLMEVIIVLALMGILMAMATPSMIAWRESARNKEVAREILAGLRQARSLAVTSGQPVTFTINPATREMTIGTITRDLPGNAEIEVWEWVTPPPPPPPDWELVVGNGVVVFFPQGNSDERIRVRVDNNVRLTVEISSTASGLARIN